MKKFKVCFSILMIILITAFCQSSVWAAVTHELGIVQLREDGYAYKVKTGSGDRMLDVFKIVEYINGNKNFQNDIYCIKGGPGFGGTVTDPLQHKNYDISYDLKNVANIPTNYKNLLPSDTEITKEITINNEKKQVTYTNYNALLWLVDNMYLPKYQDDTARKAMRDNLLKAAFKEKLEDKTLTPAFTLDQIKLTDSDIEVVQQLAIWHFTNADDNQYDVGTKLPAIQISAQNDTSKYDGFDMSSYRQEDSQTLYQYLINNAMLNASSYGNGDNRHLTTPVQLANNTLTTQYTTNNFVVGPFRINKVSELPYTLEANVCDQNDAAISKYTLYTKNSSGSFVAVDSQKTIPDMIDQDFYIAVGKDTNTTAVKLKLKISYYESDANFWTVSSSPNSEQAVVMIEKKPQQVEQTAGLEYNFDLALRKFITGVNDTEVTNRVPQVTVDKTTGKITYNHTKDPVEVESGDIVTYTIRIFNEGKVAGYANVVKDDIPEGLEFLPDNEINKQYGWSKTSDGKSIVTNYLQKDDNKTNLLKPFDKDTMASPDYRDVKVAFKVTEPNSSKKTIINIAEINDDSDENGNPIEDIDSTPGNGVDGEDDIDKEYLKLKPFDLALRKFITGVNDKQITNRVPQVTVDNSTGKITYNHTKDPVSVQNGDIVIYTIRIYNEGETSGYADEITDDIPEGTKFIIDNEINTQYRWKLSADEKKVTTDYLSQQRDENNLLKAFDKKTMKTPDYKEVKIALQITEPNTSKNVLVNTAEISEDSDKNGNPVDDIDSTPGNGVDGEDDIDKEYVKLVSFDLALRKFITGVNDTPVTDRVPEVQIDGDGKISYHHKKDPVLVANSDVVVYTIRIFNEGTTDGYAESVRDDVPDGLKFIPDNDINKQYGWVVSDDGKEITTDYLSKSKAVDNLIKAFDPDNMTTPDYKDVKVAFLVTEEMLPTDRILINTAEINNDADGNGNSVDDIDSTPGNGVDGEDDIDKEYVRVQYFDLSLLKWVSKVYLTENGETTEQDTGHTGLENPEPVVKVDLDRRNINKVTVKFGYTIKITNEGEIAGYAKEISDYIPDGLEFVAEDNPNWTEADGKITTRALENTLLQPGESATVTVILKWKNDANNLGVKVNVAEISEDYNDKHAHDIDSTPNNKVEGEDDIDNAPVALSIKTGQSRIFYTLIGIIGITVAGGIVLIKRYVL